MGTRSRFAALVAASSMVLALAAPALGYSATVNEAASVAASLTVTGIPASVNYGSALVGGTTSATQTIDANISTNGSWTLFLSGLDFTGPGGATIGKGQRDALLSKLVSSPGNPAFQVPPTASSWQAFDSATLTDATADVSGGAGSFDVRTELRLRVPAGQAAGAYTSSITFLITNP